jgi:replicative DNA helicase
MTNHQNIVIGGLCYEHTTDATWMACQQNGITSEHFTAHECRLVFECVESLKSKGKPVYMTTIHATAVSLGLELSHSDIQEFVDHAVTIQAYINNSVESVKMDWIRRMAHSEMLNACEQIKTTDDPASVIQSIQGKLTMMQTQSNRFCKINHITAFREAKVSAWRQATGQGYIGIPSCFSEMNQYLGGYRRGVMTVVGGYRGEGKSTLARQEAHGTAKQGYKALVVSLEDPEDVAQASIAGNEASVSVFHLDTGSSFEGRIEQIDSAWAGMGGIPLWTASATTIEEICSLATIKKATDGLDLLVIDHLQYISPYTLPRMDRNGTIATYSQRICNLAKTLDIAVMVLSQFSRDSEKNNRKPKLSDLRDSGTIEQDARAVLLLYFDPVNKHHILEVAKNNNGVSKKEIKLVRADGKQRFEPIQT